MLDIEHGFRQGCHNITKITITKREHFFSRYLLFEAVGIFIFGSIKDKNSNCNQREQELLLLNSLFYSFNLFFIYRQFTFYKRIHWWEIAIPINLYNINVFPITSLQYLCGTAVILVNLHIYPILEVLRLILLLLLCVYMTIWLDLT